ncbi:MAG: hypothetical protein IJ534_04200 [Bacteroidaceae bacterium]|nr:hypothetical protein [Bacteroidaceae bacterium]
MRKYKNIQMLAALLMAGTAFTACTNDDFAEATPQQGKTYTLSVNATKGADTRTLTEETDGSLTATWNLDDEVAVYLDGEKVGTLKPDNTEANALLTGDVTGVTVGDELDLVFSSDNYNSQEGTLEYIDTNCNYAKATVTVNAIVGDAVKTSNAVFENQQSITKFTFNKEVSEVVIDYGDDAITVTPAAATSTLYVAIPATIGEADFTFTATVDGKTYKGEKSATLEKGKFYTASIELSADLDDYIDLSADATANTYMVTAAGKYKFKATVKGNGGLDPITGTTATSITGIAGVKVLWELKAQGLAIKYADDAYDIFYANDYVYFSTPDTFTSGDAYVAVYDSEGTILWSWLIWATDKPEEKFYDGLAILDRNIGALSVNGDTYRAGFLYQWGRKDPFPAGTTFNAGTQYTFVPTKDTAFSNESFENGSTMEYSIEHPTTLIGPARYNWLQDDEFNVNLWLSSSSEKTIYDPCPAGWRIPSKDELNKVFSSGVTLPGGGAAAGDSYFGGYCNGGSQYYWSSTADSKTEAWSWYDGKTRTANNSSWPDWRLSSAMSIRPVRDLIASDYLVQHWPFDGDTKNAIAGGVDAVNSGATLTTDRHGNENSAYDFSSSKMTASGAANFGTSSFTANIWVCSTQASAAGNLMRTDDGYSENGWLLRFNYGSLEIWEGRSKGYAFVSKEKFNDGNWHMVTYVRDVENKEGKLYVDGVYIGRYEITDTVNNVSNTLKFGTYGSGEYYTGIIDDARLYNKALTATEVAALYVP